MFCGIALAGVVGKSRRPGGKASVLRLVLFGGLLLGGLVLASSTAEFFGVPSLNQETVNATLANAEGRTSEAGSSFSPVSMSNPANAPLAFATVLYRPFPFEVSNAIAAVSALEGVYLVVLTWRSRSRLRSLLRSMRRDPYAAYSSGILVTFVYAFSAFSNFGILARQRCQVLPFFLVLLCLPVWRREGVISTEEAVSGRDDLPDPRLATPAADPYAGVRQDSADPYAGVEPQTTRTGGSSTPPHPGGAEVRAVRADELGPDWTSSSTFALLDHRVVIASDEPALVSLADELYAPLRADVEAEHVLALGRAEGPEGEGWFAAADGTVLVRAAAPGVAFSHLVFAANQHAIDDTAGVRLHAAAAVRDGHAVLLPGVMNAGKSTLVAGLVRRGWAHLTDEVAALDAYGRVRPYARPLSLGSPPPALTWEWRPPAGARPFLASSGLVPATALGAVARDPAVVAAVVLPEYVRDAPVGVEHLDPADALVAIAAQTFHLDVPGTLAAVAERFPKLVCARVHGGDLTTMCDAVDAVMAEVSE